MNATPRQRQSSEEPEWYFRGSYFPPELWELVKDREVNGSECLLLLLIDSLVKCRGLGCWASNAYLGSVIHVSARHVRRMVERLRDMDLVRVKFTGKQRFLEAAWSRLPTEKRSVRMRKGQ